MFLVSDSVQVEFPPGFTVVGEQLREIKAAGADKPSENVFEPFRLAVSVAFVSLATAEAVAVNVAVVAPTATVTDPGTLAAPLSLDNATLAPPAGAAELNVTVQLLVPGVVTVAGVQLNPAGCSNGLSVTLAVRFTPPAEAVIVPVVALTTVPAVAANVVLDVPAETVTVAGTVIAA